MKIKSDWEQISVFSYRMKVIGGWIVNTSGNFEGMSIGEGSVFVPDPKWEWEVQ